MLLRSEDRAISFAVVLSQYTRYTRQASSAGGSLHPLSCTSIGLAERRIAVKLIVSIHFSIIGLTGLSQILQDTGEPSYLPDKLISEMQCLATDLNCSQCMIQRMELLLHYCTILIDLMARLHIESFTVVSWPTINYYIVSFAKVEIIIIIIGYINFCTTNMTNI